LQKGKSNLQVLKFAKTPKAWVPGHLPEAQGMQTATSMALLKEQVLGMVAPVSDIACQLHFPF